jgi:rhodanese-related sulfurtransferase/DNA-binding transcriptional ArsR family regulator
MNKREFKGKVYRELARITKALGNPHRMEIIDLLAQGPFSVEQIANYTGMSVANASQHLQVLKNAKLVTIERKGNFINYTLSSEKVFDAWSGLRKLGQVFNTEIEKIVNDFRKGYGVLDPVDANSLAKMVKKDEVIVLDVRSEEEYSRGHIHRAISIPIDELSKQLKKIPKDKTIVAYCRGPFCVYADEAVAILNKKGFVARRLNEGFPDWALNGLPVTRSPISQ